MNKTDIENAIGVSTLDDLHLGLSLDDLFAVPVEAKWLALCALRFKAPATHAMVSPMHKYTPQAAVSLLCAAMGMQVEAERLVDSLFSESLPGQYQAENLLLAYALYVGCVRLESVADWSQNSFRDAVEQANFTDDGFRWFYPLHIGFMALKHGMNFELGRVGACMPWFGLGEHAKELFESLSVVQSFVNSYPSVFLKRVGDERFKAVLSHLRAMGVCEYVQVEFESADSVLSLYR